MNFCSAWIEDNNINPYNEHKEQMLKLGKGKAAFNKAIKEIDQFMNNPSVSVTISHYWSFVETSISLRQAELSQLQLVKRQHRRSANLIQMLMIP